MIYKATTVCASEVAADDDTYRITTRDEIASLAAAIETIGLINPPVLLPTAKKRYVIVSGFRRVAACRALSRDRFKVLLLDPDTSVQQCALVAIAENCAQRELNLVEISRAIRLLSMASSDDRGVSKLAGNAGLPLAPAMVKKLRPLCRLPQKFQQGIIAGAIALPMAQRLQGLPETDAREVYDLFREIRAGLNVQREILDHAEETARREGLRLKDVLRSAALMEIRADQDYDPHRKAGLIRTSLKRRRYPALSAAEETFKRQSGKLGLRSDMKLVPPPGFEGPDYRLTLRFRSLDQLKRQAKVLEKLVAGTVIKEILE